MTLIKSAPRSATLALCPHSPLLATGSIPGAVDLSFSTNSKLEIFALDFSSPSVDLPLAGGSVSTPDPLNRLAWTSFDENQSFPYGVIAGGLADGTICLWNPAKVIGTPVDNEDVQGALLSKMNKHTGGVSGLEFNHSSHNLLASGGIEGEIGIWDVSNPTQPSLYPAMKTGGPEATQATQPGMEITHLSWNIKVQHILASSTASGTVVVWDLKRQKPWMSLRDPQRRRASWLQWSPEVATQVVVAADDDTNPTIHFWDLRNPTAPLKQLQGHTKGVLSLSWCKQDPRLLLSSGKDNRILCWDVHTSDIIADIPTESWAFNVEWSLKTPGVFASSSFDGKVGLSSVTNFAKAEATPTGIPKHTPNWLKRPVSAAFGFNGFLATCMNTAAGAQTIDTITITQVITEGELVEQSQEFDNLVRDMDKEKLREVCDKKVAVTSAEEAETWEFLKLLFEDDARRQLLSQLGFVDMLPLPPGEDAAAIDGITGSATGNSAAASADLAAQIAALELTGDDIGFFEQEHEHEVFLGDAPPQAAADTPAGNGVEAPVSAKGEPSGEGEAQIERALMVGNYTAAVDECFKVGRVADALLIARIGGDELWRKAQQLYMTQQPRPYMKLLQAIYENNLEALIRTRPVAVWRETLAILATYATSDDWAQLCNTLGLHLAAAGMYHAATLCYICASNVDEAVTQWAAGIKGASVSVKALQCLMEKAVVLGIGSGSHKASPALSDLVNHYVSILASQGQVSMAWEYLELVPGEVSTGTAILKDRLYRSGAAQIPHDAPVPQFPFEATPIVASAHHPVTTQGYTSWPTEQVTQPQQYAGYAPQPTQPQAVAAPLVYQPPAPQYPTYVPPQPQAPQYPTYGQSAAIQPTPPAVAPPPTAAPPAFVPRQPPVVEQPKVFTPAAPAMVPSASRPPPSMGAPPPVSPSARTSGPLLQQQPSSGSLGGAPPQAVVQPPPVMHTMQPPLAQPPMQPGGGGVFIPGGPDTAPAAAVPPPVQPTPPPQPVGPPTNINIETVNTSAVTGDLKAIVTSLTNLYHACLPAAASNARIKREMDDNSKRLGQLFWKLNAGDVSPEVTSKLQQLCRALDSADYAAASHLQINLTTSNWDECSTWLSALKRLIKTRSSTAH